MSNLIQDLNDDLPRNEKNSADLSKLDSFASNLINDIFNDNNTTINSSKVDESSSLIDSSNLIIDSYNR